MEQGYISFSLFLLVLIISPLPAKAEGDDSFRSVRHIKILSCPDFFWRPLIYWLDVWYVAIYISKDFKKSLDNLKFEQKIQVQGP
jgi:hypothetical protein